MFRPGSARKEGEYIMPLSGIPQPDILAIDAALRLKKAGDSFAFALPWYQDPETLMLVDGKAEPYDMPHLTAMYRYLEQHGELYWIEWRTPGGDFEPVGDVTLWQEDLPIVIGRKDLRGRGIGHRTVAALMERARRLGWRELYVNEIYSFNTASRALFEGLGFAPCARTPQGARYRCSLD